MTLTFLGHVTSRDHSNPSGSFPIGGPLDLVLYLHPFSRYLALSTDVISHVTVRIPMGHDLDLSWSRDVISHVTIQIPMGHFLLVVHWTQVCISIRFRDIWHYAY